MNKKFIKSMVTAIAGLGLISSCSMLGMKSHNKCGGKNNCKSKMTEESSKCASKKSETNKCSTKKSETNVCGSKNGCAGAKAKKSSSK